MTVHGLRADTSLLPVAAVAARLGVTPDAVYQLVRRGRLPASKPGGRDLLISAADLAAYETTHRARLVSDDGTPGSDVLVRASETRHVANAMAVEQLAEQTFAVRGTHHDDAVVVRTEEGGEYRLDEGGWPSHWLAGFREVAVGNPGRWIGPFMVHRAPYPVVCTKWTVESLADSDRGRFHAILRPFVPPATQIDLALSPSDLRGCRHGLGLTQAQLAHALGVSRSAVARWEQGTRAAPRHLRLAMEALAARAHEEAPQGVTPDEVQPGIAP